MGIATKEAIRETLNLLTVLSKDLKDKDNIRSTISIFLNWIAICNVNQQFAEITVKYVAFILRNGGKSLKLEAEKVPQMRAICERL